MNKSYIGDGVYADLDDFGAVVLTTENGYQATNTIVLEPEVLTALEQWLAQLRQAAQAEAAKEVET